MVSTETPSQDVPSFDHRVTQCKSTVKVSVGKWRNDFQSHRLNTSVPSSIVNSHWSSGTWGVGPADKTGKSVVRYCPGGNFTSAARRRPEKPREMIPIRHYSPLSRVDLRAAPVGSFTLQRPRGGIPILCPRHRTLRRSLVRL